MPQQLLPGTSLFQMFSASKHLILGEQQGVSAPSLSSQSLLHPGAVQVLGAPYPNTSSPSLGQGNRQASFWQCPGNVYPTLRTPRSRPRCRACL